MAILFGFLTTLLVLNCVFLILLVLIQLPKKEAGVGMAFGGGATEALFGAGTGTVLTKATKYSAGIFMGLSLLLAVANAHRVRQSGDTLRRELERKAAEAARVVTPGTNAGVISTSAPALLLTSTNVAPANSGSTTTNLPAESAK
jgi:preprotein translocase subunit SecG